LEEKCRKMALLIKEKKKKKAEMKEEENATILNGQKLLTKDELKALENQLKAAEQEKLAEERKLKDQVKG
jgi:hypothetical protein